MNISILHKYDYYTRQRNLEILNKLFQFYISTIITDFSNIYAPQYPTFQFYISTIITSFVDNVFCIWFISILHKYDYYFYTV